MKKLKHTRLGAVIIALLALMLVAAGCASEDSSGDDESSNGGGGDKTVTLGIIGSWTDGKSTAYLWKNILEKEGYTVEIKDIADAAPLYTGLAKGDIDVYPSAWSDATHKSYMDKYGDDLTDLGTYYDNAKLTLAVPTYSDLESIEDLKGKGAEFDGKIIGIEPGAGLTKITKENVIPDYDLGDEFKLVESSTASMLTELKKATDDKKEIVVTLWRPFWANSEFPVKDLEDPKGALGESEGLHEMANKDWAADNPEVADMMGKLKLDDQAYGDLENMVVNEFGEGKEEEAIEAFLEEHPEVEESLK